MKKFYIIMILGVLFCLTGCSEKQQKTQTISHAFNWEGTVCTGTYTGKVKDGRPEGKGEFKGYLLRGGQQTDEVTYTGKWSQGKLDGKGVFTNLAEKVSYEGKFAENSRKGKFLIKRTGQDVYEKVAYSNDIPYGISVLYDTDTEEIAGYDRYYLGRKVSEIIGMASEISYGELMYNMDKYYCEEIYLDATVVKKSWEKKSIGEKTENYAVVLVEDKDGKRYLISYSLYFSKTKGNYMPDLQIGDNVQIYGFAKGFSKQEGGQMGEKYPVIEGVYAKKDTSVELDLEKMPLKYQNFIDYSYEYMNKEIEITGIVNGMESNGERTVLLVESDSYCENGENIYVCFYDKESWEKTGSMPVFGDTVTIKGEIKPAYCVVKKKGFIIYPRLVVEELTID